MEIKETPIFTKQIINLMPDEDYNLLQIALILNPELGPIIKGSGGIRKIRWSLPGKGKRGGSRIIYYWQLLQNQIFMLIAYSKHEQENFTKKQLKILKEIVETELKNG